MTHRMEHYTITAPHVTNNGGQSNYVSALERRLLASGIDGFTQTPSIGCWRGKFEAGTVFTIYMPARSYAGSPSDRLTAFAHIGRKAMPDQEAIRVTYHGTILLQEG